MNIVIAEDDAVDVMALRRSLNRSGINHKMTVVKDGLDVLAVVRGMDGNPPVSDPYILILDLNMPRKRGLEVLQELNGSSLPAKPMVFVWTTSLDPNDKTQAISYGVCGYFRKPQDSEDLSPFVVMLQNAWRMIVQFPH